MKKTNKGFTIDIINEEVRLTKKFISKANVYGSDEYNTLVGLKKDFADFKFMVKEIEKKPEKVSYNGLTIYKMIAAIEYIKNEDAAKFFEGQINVYKGSEGSYAKAKSLFLYNYKNEYNKIMLNKNIVAEIDKKALAIKERYVKAKIEKNDNKKENSNIVDMPINGIEETENNAPEKVAANY